MNNYCSFSKDHHCIKWQDYVSARLELEECDELCHGNWIEIESLQRQVDFLKKLLEENSIVLPDDYYDLYIILYMQLNRKNINLREQTD